MTTSDNSPVLMCWSGGKDSAMALHALRESGRSVAALLTTVTERYDRISMHGVRQDLLERQAQSIGVPLARVVIPRECSHEQYADAMRAALEPFIAQGVRDVAFGDLFLEDVRKYREERLAQVALRAIFPVWGADTRRFAEDFIRLGFKAILTCVDTDALDASFSGRDYDASLIAGLPATVDPCGENGEFHSFVHDGPVFSAPIPVVRGERVLRDSRWQYTDLLPG